MALNNDMHLGYKLSYVDESITVAYALLAYILHVGQYIADITTRIASYL